MGQKFFWNGKGNCPHCGQSIEIKVRKITEQKPIPGKYVFRPILEKDTQTTLQGDEK